MIVETKLIGRNGAERRDVVITPGSRPLRELLRAVVLQELRDYEARRADGAALRVLTPADLARGVEAGSYGREARTTKRAPAVDDAVATALQAVEDGTVLVLLDGAEVASLDTVITIGPASTLRLVRLVALAGGHWC